MHPGNKGLNLTALENLTNKEDILRYIDEINEYAWNIRANASNTPVNLLDKGKDVLEKAEQLGYTYGKARALLNTGMGTFILQHDYANAMVQINRAIELFREMGDKKWLANSLLTVAIINTSASKPEEALYHALKGIEFYETLDSYNPDWLMAYYVIGTVYKDLKKISEAERYYKKGLRFNEVEPSAWAGRIYTSLSNLYTEQEKYSEALHIAGKAHDLFVSQDNSIGASRALNDIGFIYKKQLHFEKALEYFLRALSIRETLNLKQFALTSITETAEVYTELKNYEKAIEYLNRAATLAQDVKQPGKLAKIYRDTASVYKTMEDFKSALEYNEKFLEITLDSQKTEREAKLSSLQNALVQEKEQEIERLKNVELKNAYHLISEKNKEITDSIQYAKRIQKALLATDGILHSNLDNHFVLYKPKDIVSGDFYWATAVQRAEIGAHTEPAAGQQTANAELFFLAVCDSTGHGVPGAFMSLLNITFLNEAITEKKITEPNLIFDHVRKRLIDSISQDGGKDGMDGILVCFDKTNGTITYAAANNAPVLLSGGELHYLPCDKMPVGKGERTNPFTLFTTSVKPGDTLYLYTDGYADQFGGPKGKKFKYRQLNDLVLSVNNLPMQEQVEILNAKFEDWKGELQQVDDVCIIGIKMGQTKKSR